MAVIQDITTYAPDPQRGGRPLFFGKIYVGQPDLDPEIPANQKQLRVKQEDGTLVDVLQPFELSAGGVPVYNGAPVRLDVDGNYSIKVLDSNNQQIYYIHNAYEGEPLIAEDLPELLISDLSQAYEFDTMSNAAGTAINFPLGKILRIGDRVSALFEVVTIASLGGAPLSGKSQVEFTNFPTLALKYKPQKKVVLADELGIVGSADDTAAINEGLSLLVGGGIFRLNKSITYMVSGIATSLSGTIFDLSGATLRQISGTNSVPMIQFGDAVNRYSKMAIINGTIDGNKSNVTGNLAFGLIAYRIDGLVYEGITFKDVRRQCYSLNFCTHVRVTDMFAENLGVTATAIGTLVAMNNCENVVLENHRVLNSEGVGGFIQSSVNVSIENFTAKNITLDNGLTIDDGCTNVILDNINIENCINQGLEISETIGLSMTNVKSINNGVYGVMLNVFSTGPESPCRNVIMDNINTSGNGTNGVRLIGTKNTEITNATIADDMFVTDSSGSVTTLDTLTIKNSTISSLELFQGLGIELINNTIATFIPRAAAKHTLIKQSNAPITSTPRQTVANGASVTLTLPVNTSQSFCGLLTVGSWFTGSRSQNTTELFHVSDLGTLQATSISRVDGSTARPMTVTVVGNNQILITNNSGAEVLLSAQFTGAAT